MEKKTETKVKAKAKTEVKSEVKAKAETKVKKETVAEGRLVKAIGNSIRTSPRKLNLVAQSIRGLSVAAALAELTFSRKRIANAVKEVVQSAVANAENNCGLNIDKLYIKEAYVGKGLVMKRMHARGRGRGARVLKPFSNLTVVVTERQGAK